MRDEIDPAGNRKVTLTVRLTQKDYDELTECSREDWRTRSATARMAIREYVDRRNKKAPKKEP